MHSRTTAREILADFAGERLDYWVTGFGTGGTLKGVARVLAQGAPRDADRRLRARRRADARQRHAPGAQRRRSPRRSHPSWKPHPMQGWSPDFIPKLTGDAVDDRTSSTRVLPVNGADAMRCSRQLAQKEGIFVGITAGATFAGALQVCEDAPPGATVLCMLPDTGERYLSTPLFADIAPDMTDEELQIALDAGLPLAAQGVAPRPDRRPSVRGCRRSSQPADIDVGASGSRRRCGRLRNWRGTSSIVVTPARTFSMPSWRSVRMPSVIAARCKSSARAPVWISRRISRETTINSCTPARPRKPVWSHCSQPALWCRVIEPALRRRRRATLGPAGEHVAARVGGGSPAEACM